MNDQAKPGRLPRPTGPSEIARRYERVAVPIKGTDAPLVVVIDPGQTPEERAALRDAARKARAAAKGGQKAKAGTKAAAKRKRPPAAQKKRPARGPAK